MLTRRERGAKLRQEGVVNVALPVQVKHLLRTAAKTEVGNTFNVGRVKARVLCCDPLVLELPGFITPHLKEISKITSLKLPWRRSKTQKESGDLILDQDRTSQSCLVAPERLASLKRKVSDLTGFCDFEPLQLVRYRAGEQFDTHHDAGTLVADSEIVLVPPGPVRPATIFGYVTDSKAGTFFPDLNLVTDARKGNAVFFLNVDSTGKKLDARTAHSGVKLERGDSKLGINIWPNV